MTDNDKMREAFEARFPVPDGVYWNEDKRRYTAHYHESFELYHESLRLSERQRELWQAWQAAQDEQSAELERLRKDAERWRVVRQNGYVTEEAIDAAIAAEGEK